MHRAAVALALCLAPVTVAEGALPALVAMLSAESDTSYHAVQAVAQFAADQQYRVSLAETGGLGALTPLLASHLPHVQQCALSALANSSFVPGAVNQLAASGALAHAPIARRPRGDARAEWSRTSAGDEPERCPGTTTPEIRARFFESSGCRRPGARYCCSASCANSRVLL